MEEYLREKRKELVWGLQSQGYNGGQLARLFQTDRMTISRIMAKMPEGYVSPWTKD